MNTRSQLRTISWQLLRGNKYIRALHPAMLNPNGLLKTTSITPVGGRQQETLLVHYGRDYVVQWLAFKVIKPFQLLQFDEIYSLLLDAWYLVNPSEKPPLDLNLANVDSEE